MSYSISLAQLSKILDTIDLNLSDSAGEKNAIGISTDTRRLKPGEVFLALSGENFNGHDFIHQAVEKGAIAVITQSDSSEEIPKNVPQFRVRDTLKAYQKIGRWWRDQVNIPVIGITGSVGKTTTKELIAAVLSSQGEVLKTQANYNNEIGVPKTLLQLQPTHKYAVIEMAMRARGEIAELTEISRPTIGVITNVGTAHIGRLGSEEAIAQAKCELLAMMPATSVAVLNADNERLMKTATKVWHHEMMTYGLKSGEIQGKLLNSTTLEVDGVEFKLPLAGRHNALNYLAALAVARILGIDWQSLRQGIQVEMPGGRSRRYNLANDVVVLDETYNAGFESMIAAMELLKETPGERHIAILGTMKELGDKSAQLHAQVGEMAQKLHLDALFVLVNDPEAQIIAESAQKIPSECFNTKDELVQHLLKFVQKGDRLLFKASNSVGLTSVVEKFCAQYQ